MGKRSASFVLFMLIHPEILHPIFNEISDKFKLSLRPYFLSPRFNILLDDRF
jgi:hypothetical protein